MKSAIMNIDGKRARIERLIKAVAGASADFGSRAKKARAKAEKARLKLLAEKSEFEVERYKDQLTQLAKLREQLEGGENG